MALENVRPGRRITALESFVVAMAAAERYRFITTPEWGQTIACADHVSVYFNHYAPLRDLTGALLWMAQHELEHHADTATVVPPARPDDTAVIPVVASAGNRPDTATARHGAATNGVIPPGTDWTALAGVGLDVRHRSGRAVPVHRVDYTDGSQVFTLPADGFPGATWEVRASAPYVPSAPFRATGPAEHPLTCGHPVPDRWISTGCVICRSYLRLSGFEPPRAAPYRAEDHAADACSRCGLDVTKDPARVVLPPPLGSLSATHPATLCGSCGDGLVALVGQYVTDGLLDTVTGHTPDDAPATSALATERCSACGGSLQRCNASGCGQRQAPGWRVARQSGNGIEVRG